MKVHVGRVWIFKLMRRVSTAQMATMIAEICTVRSPVLSAQNCSIILQLELLCSSAVFAVT
jgi:hypothetical protein